MQIPSGSLGASKKRARGQDGNVIATSLDISNSEDESLSNFPPLPSGEVNNQMLPGSSGAGGVGSQMDHSYSCFENLQNVVHTVQEAPGASQQPPMPAPTLKYVRNNMQPTEKPQSSDSEENLEKKVRVPPIVIRDASKVKLVRNLLATAKVSNPKDGHTKGMGYQIYPDTPKDYREAIKVLKDNDIEFHHFTLKDDKPLKVVLRGVPIGESIDDIVMALEAEPNNYTVLKATRLINRLTKKPMQLVVVEVPREERRIYELTSLLHSRIVPESLRKPSVIQCHRCQQFGHSQNCCNATPACVKCGRDHFAVNCPRKRTVAAYCVNCKVTGHPASWTGCPKWPKPRVQHEGAQPRAFTSNKVNPNFSYARTVAPQQPSMPQAAAGEQSSIDMISVPRSMFEMMQKMMSRMDKFLESQENMYNYV